MRNAAGPLRAALATCWLSGSAFAISQPVVRLEYVIVGLPASPKANVNEAPVLTNVLLFSRLTEKLRTPPPRSLTTTLPKDVCGAVELLQPPVQWSEVR